MCVCGRFGGPISCECAAAGGFVLGLACAEPAARLPRPTCVRFLMRAAVPCRPCSEDAGTAAGLGEPAARALWRELASAAESGAVLRGACLVVSCQQARWMSHAPRHWCLALPLTYRPPARRRLGLQLALDGRPCCGAGLLPHHPGAACRPERPAVSGGLLGGWVGAAGRWGGATGGATAALVLLLPLLQGPRRGVTLPEPCPRPYPCCHIKTGPLPRRWS